MHTLLIAPSGAAPARPLRRTSRLAPFSALACLMFLASALSGFAQSVVTTITGINGPTFMAIDPNRTINGTTATWLYVSEHGQANNTGGGRILRYNVASLSTAPTDIGGGNFTSPDAILIDAATGNLTIADRARNRIVKISNSGAVLSTFGSGTAGATDEMHGPCGLATDSAGNIYVAEHGDTAGSVGNGGSYISKYTSAGSQLWRHGGIGGIDGQFANTGPYGIAILNNLLYVSDAFNSRIQVFDLNGVFQTKYSMPNALPLGLFVDSGNALWVAQATNSPDGTGAIQQVQKFPTPGGAASVTLTDGFSLPFDTVVNSATSYAYVADYYHNRVVVFDLNGSSTPAVPVINSSATASGTVGQNFSYTITATNSPYQYANLDALPAGLTLDTSTGAVTGIPTAAGTTTTHLTATNSAGTSASFALTTTIQAATPPPPPATVPTIQSIALGGGATYTHANFVVTFNEAVTGVDATDFAFNRTGTTGPATITQVTPSGGNTVYTVDFDYDGDPTTHTTDTLNGSLQLGIKTSGTGIVDGSGHAFVGNGVTASDAVQVNAAAPGADLTLPVVSSFTGSLSGSTATFTLTFSKPVTNVDTTDFLVNASGVTPGALTVTGTGTTYTAQVPVTGNGTISLTVIGGVSANVRDAATNWFAGGGTSTSNSVTVGTPTGSAPVVTNATVTGAVGTPITNVQVQATNSPQSFSAPGLTAYGLAIDNSGVISGTPTAAAAGATVNVTATNSFGTSAAATITLNISAAPPSGSAPVVSNASVSGTVGTPITNVQVQATNSPQTFSAPGLTAYGLAIDNSGVISGTPTTTATNATVSVTATNSAGTSAAATITLNISAAQPPSGSAPALTVPSTVNGVVGQPVHVQVTATNSPTSYSLFSQPPGVTIDATGLISGTPTVGGTYDARVTASNSAGSDSATITFIITSSNPPPQGQKSQTIVFIPPVSRLLVGDTIQLSATSSSGMPVTYQLITGNATLSGTSLTFNSASAVVVRASQSGDATWSSASADATFNPVKRAQSIATSSIPTTIHTDGALKLSATTDAGLPITYTVVSGPATVSNNTLTFTGSGAVVLRAAQAGNGTYDSAESTVTITGNPVPRLVNISSRLHATGGDASRTSIAGFVVTGTSPKQMLIRAIGPGLSAFGVANGLADPQLQLYDNTGKLIASNSGWNNDAAIAAAGDATGAFRLGANSKDSAILMTLQPGSYTAQVQSANNGIVLIEVYDVASNSSVPTKQLINISTRGYVGTGDDAIIGGFVVSGNEPKKVLIRAVGPSLAQFNVPGTLADPVVTVYDNNHTIVAKNDNWGTPQPISSSQTAATAAEITAASTASGAFPLTTGSADAAVIVTLNPGAYSAVVSGANNSTGTALVEIYEIPNP